MKVKTVKGKRGKYLLRWVDAVGKTRERTTNLATSKANYKEALKIAAKLEQELAGEMPPDLMLTTKQRDQVQSSTNDPHQSQSIGEWAGFRLYFFQTHLSGLSSTYPETMGPILDRFERFANPQLISDVKTPVLRRWFASLRDDGLAAATVRSYWGHLRAFLSIARDDGIIADIPHVRLPKIDRTSLAKGRPINLEEFERMFCEAGKLRPKQQANLEFLLEGLWLSGLRISEAYRITWGESGFYVDMESKRPRFVIMEQKNRKRQLLPMTPDFADFLRRIPTIRRVGTIFQLDKSRGVGRVSLAQMKKIIGMCGDGAGIITGDGKTASAHDLRRSFATRWASKVLPQVLQQLMRHSEIATTMKYYANLDADVLAEAIYEGNENLQSKDKTNAQTENR